jgi:hypothetical protein
MSEKTRKRLPANVIRHDVFNIIYVAALAIIDIHYIITRHGFWVLWYATFIYFVADGVWVSQKWNLGLFTMMGTMA